MEARKRTSVDASLGISRRTLLKRGAIVGGSLVWTVPVVHTLATPSANAGTPLDRISLVAVVLRSGDVHYRIKWDVIDGKLVEEAGPKFVVPGAGSQMMDYPDIRDSFAPGTRASMVGEAIRIDAPGDSVLVDFIIRQGPCSIVSGTYGTPLVGTRAPWLFNPLAAPPDC